MQIFSDGQPQPSSRRILAQTQMSLLLPLQELLAWAP